MRILGLLVVGIVSCAAASSALAVGGGSLADDVKEGCKAGLESYCKQVTPGEGRLLACLYAFEDKLSARCDYALHDAAVRLEHAVASLSYSAAECKDDIEKHCAKVEAGEGRIVDCLKKQGDKLSKRCSQAMKDVGLE